MKLRLLKDMPNLHPTLKEGDVINCPDENAALKYIKNGAAEDASQPKTKKAK